MTAVPWHDGLAELRRLLGQDPDRIEDPEQAWAAFRDFLAIPLDGLFDSWDGDMDADTLVVEHAGPRLLIARRFAVPATGEAEDLDELDMADTVQLEIELFFDESAAEPDDRLWTSFRSGEFTAEDLAEATAFVVALRLGKPIRSAVALTTV